MLIIDKEVIKNYGDVLARTNARNARAIIKVLKEHNLSDLLENNLNLLKRKQRIRIILM